MRVPIFLPICLLGGAGCVPPGVEGEGEGEGEPLACEDVGCVVRAPQALDDCADAATLMLASGQTALSIEGVAAVEFGEGPPPALIGGLNCTSCLSSPVVVRAARHDLSGTSLLEIIGDVVISDGFFRAQVQPAAVEQSGSWAVQIIDAFGNASSPVCGIYQFRGV